MLVNNAGISPVAPSSLETTEQLFDKILAVNLRACFRLCALFGTQMSTMNGGCIVNISSSGSLRPEPGFGPHAAAKAGWTGDIASPPRRSDLGATVVPVTVMVFFTLPRQKRP
jgi:NAD(P)-dependent dehydrogenase (short-subunit alcohol dehydrogenase family)